MKPTLINKCNTSYRIDYEKILGKILERIPDKFLHSLSEVVFLSKGETNSQRMEYLFGKKGKSSKIEINMDYNEYSKYPFFSIFSLNMDFLIKINEHVERTLKPVTNDPDILAYSCGKVNYNWMYLGIWSPFIYLFVLCIYPIRKAQSFRNAIFRLSDRIIKNTKHNGKST